jgi:hypothetical protein
MATLTVKRVKNFVIEAEDKPGVLAQFAKTLRDSGVNLKGLWGFGTQPGKAQIYCVPEDEAKFREACQKAGKTAKEGSCFSVSGEDRPGALCDLLDKVAAAKVNIHALDAISTGGVFGAYLWGEAKDIEALGKALGA